MTPEQVIKAVSEAPRPLRAIIVAFRYGARTAAAQFFEGGIDIAIWLQVNLLKDHVAESVVAAIESCLRTTQVDTSEAALSRVLMEQAARLGCAAGCFSRTTGALSWDPTCEAVTENWLLNVSHPRCADTNLFSMRGDLKALVLQAVDLGRADEVRNAVVHNENLLLFAEVATTSIRCRAVASEVCSGYVTARAPFGAVFRIAAESHKAYVEQKLQGALSDMRLLLWIDFSSSLYSSSASSSSASNNGQLAADVNAWLVSLRMRGFRCHVIYTCDEPTHEEFSSVTHIGDEELNFDSFIYFDNINENIGAEALHEEVTILCDYDLLNVFSGASLRQALEPLIVGLHPPILAMYRNDEDVHGKVGLTVRICVSDVGHLQTLRDDILSQDFQHKLFRALPDHDLPKDSKRGAGGAAAIVQDLTERQESKKHENKPSESVPKTDKVSGLKNFWEDGGVAGGNDGKQNVEECIPAS